MESSAETIIAEIRRQLDLYKETYNRDFTGKLSVSREDFRALYAVAGQSHAFPVTIDMRGRSLMVSGVDVVVETDAEYLEAVEQPRSGRLMANRSGPDQAEYHQIINVGRLIDLSPRLHEMAITQGVQVDTVRHPDGGGHYCLRGVHQGNVVDFARELQRWLSTRTIVDPPDEALHGAGRAVDLRPGQTYHSDFIRGAGWETIPGGTRITLDPEYRVRVEGDADPLTRTEVAHERAREVPEDVGY